MDLQPRRTAYTAAVEAAFGSRIVCLGLQGSQARGEAGPAALQKAPFFTLRVRHLYRTGDFLRKKSRLLPLLTPPPGGPCLPPAASTKPWTPFCSGRPGPFRNLEAKRHV